MEPKQKAIELVEFYRPLVYSHVGSQFMTGTHDERLILKNAKTCALMTVREVIEAVRYGYAYEWYNIRTKDTDFMVYWKEVKTEIENL